jgi:hypothetical protein
MLNVTIHTHYLSSGDTLLPPHRCYIIYSRDAQIFENDLSVVTGEIAGASGFGLYIWDQTYQYPTQYAKCISIVPSLLNLGTGWDWWK